MKNPTYNQSTRQKPGNLALLLALGAAALFGTSLSSHAILIMPDQLNVNGGNDAIVANAAAILAEAGAPVNNAYSGILTFTVRIKYDTLNNGNGSSAYTLFHFWNLGVERQGVGDGWNETNWGTINQGNGPGNLNGGSGDVPLTVGGEELIIITITYVANANDNMVISFRNTDNNYTGNYSFDSIRARSGNQQADFTGMSMSRGGLDSDFDGMPNAWELLYGLNPNSSADAVLDTDGDGLNNLGEYNNLSNPTLADTDGDGLTDGQEVNVYNTLPIDADTDNDQISDGEEVVLGADGFITNPLLTDTDGDGFSDSQEIAAGTNPNSAGVKPVRYVQNFNAFSNGATVFADGSSLENNNGIASVQNGALRLTQALNNGAQTVFRMPPLSDSSLGWCASFDVRISDPRGGSIPADGFSFAYGALPPSGYAPNAEEGWEDTANNISYEVDTFNLDVGVSIAERDSSNPKGNLGFIPGPVLHPGSEVAGTVICRWDPVNGASFTTTGLVTNAAFANLASQITGNVSHIFALAARTAGFDETVIIDNIAITTGANFDTDNDNLPDAWEYAHIGSLTQDAGSNLDGDGIINSQEFANGTSPVKLDTDGDGLSDSAEVTGGTSPTVVDADGDTIPDGEEIFTGADGFVTNPNAADTDNDGFDDDVEITSNSDPTNAASVPQPNLVLYYPFDVQSGTSVANGAPGGPAGTIVGSGSYTPGQNAAFGTAFLGNRTGANNAGVRTGLNATQLGLLSSYTVMAWVKFNGPSGGGNNHVFSQVNGTPVLHHGVVNGNVKFGHWGSDDDAGSLPTGVWTHLAWSWDRVKAHIFVNGVEQNIDGDNEGPLNSDAVSRIVSIAISSLDGSFNGAVDEAKIFDLAMTADQVSTASQPPVGSAIVISAISYDEANSRVLLTVTGIPAGPSFHLRSSTTLQTWTPLSPGITFDSTTPQPLAVPVNVGTQPKRFFRVEDGASP